MNTQSGESSWIDCQNCNTEGTLIVLTPNGFKEIECPTCQGHGGWWLN